MTPGATEKKFEDLPEEVRQELAKVKDVEQRRWVTTEVLKVNAMDNRFLLRVVYERIKTIGHIAELLQMLRDFNEETNIYDLFQIRGAIPKDLDLRQFAGYEEGVRRVFTEQLKADGKPRKISYGGSLAMTVKRSLGEGIDFTDIPDYEYHVRRLLMNELTETPTTNIERAEEIKINLGADIDFHAHPDYDKVVEDLYYRLIPSLPGAAKNFKDTFGDRLVVEEARKKKAIIDEMTMWLKAKRHVSARDIYRFWSKEIAFPKEIPDYENLLRALFLRGLIEEFGISAATNTEEEMAPDGLDFTPEIKAGLVYNLNHDLKEDEAPKDQKENRLSIAIDIKRRWGERVNFGKDEVCRRSTQSRFMRLLGTILEDRYTTDVKVLKFHRKFKDQVTFNEQEIPGYNKCVQQAVFHCLRQHLVITAIDTYDELGEGLPLNEEEISGYNAVVREVLIWLLATAQVSTGLRAGFFQVKEKFAEDVPFEGAEKQQYETALQSRFASQVEEGELEVVQKFWAEFPDMDFSNSLKKGFPNLLRRSTHMAQLLLKEAPGNPDVTEAISIAFNGAFADEEIETAMRIKGHFPEVDYTDAFRKLAAEDPHVFAQHANRQNWRDVFGEEVVRDLLAALPKRTDEKRNAFTHNTYDRTSKFFEHIAGSVPGFTLDVQECGVATQFIGKFGLSRISIVYQYFRNIVLLKAKQIDALPNEQQQDGITTIDELERRLKAVERKVYADEPMTTLEHRGRLEMDLLSAITGKSTHSHSSGSRHIGEIIEDFSRDMDAGRIEQAPPEYQPTTMKAHEATIEFDADRVRESYDVLVGEILTGKEKIGVAEDLRNMTLQIAEAGLLKLASVPKNPNTDAQIAIFEAVKRHIGSVATLDELMDVLLDTQQPGKRNVFSAVMRQIIFRKTFEKMTSPQVIADLAGNLRRGISGKGILGIVNLINDTIKDHVLNRERNNEDSYWEPATWARIKQAESDERITDLLKVFAPHLTKLREEVSKFEVKEGDSDTNIRVIPDRGFAGEMSGYLADACYTAVYPLLSRYPNLIPHKFVEVDDLDTEDKEFFGSMLVFELESDTGEKVLLMRAFNVPKEDAIDIGAFIEANLDRLERIGHKRGATKVVVPSVNSAISNYGMTIQHIRKHYVDSPKDQPPKKPIKLKERFAFNGADLTGACYVAREIKQAA